MSFLAQTVWNCFYDYIPSSLSRENLTWLRHGLGWVSHQPLQRLWKSEPHGPNPSFAGPLRPAIFFHFLNTLKHWSLVHLSKASRHEYLVWTIVHWHTLNVLLHNMVNSRNHFEWNPIFSHVSCHGHCTALHFDLSNTHSQNRSVFCFFCLTCLPKPPNRKGSAAPGR